MVVSGACALSKFWVEKQEGSNVVENTLHEG